MPQIPSVRQVQNLQKDGPHDLCLLKGWEGWARCLHNVLFILIHRAQFQVTDLKILDIVRDKWNKILYKEIENLE